MKIQKLYPECKDYLWGGEKLKTKYCKQTDKTPCAESWELSFHKDGLTRLANGKTLAESVTEQELGENAKAFPSFPVLIKFIDAKENLSVQVHPSDEYALQHESSFGKTEMWYIVEAEQGAGIYLGFDRDVTKEEYEAAIKENRLTEILNFYEVQAGECYFIPSGTIHAIGKGCLICEIQQSSNLTYRVYDYGRKDKNGNERELHIDKALRVTNLNKFEPIIFEDCLGKCEYFTAHKYKINGALQLTADKSSFHCITCVKGNGYIDGVEIHQGDSFFVPANYGSYGLDGNLEIVLTKI
ncbi:MAG: class I mannose-6-phosphate isomerase [Clostridia bacterium]|nr:class I mannose-6-phosphate isomerase [Clostridia bacterium]